MNDEVRTPVVSFLVPVRNDATRLAACLGSIRRNRYPGQIEIVVADNGSRDRSPEVARDAGAKVLSLPDLSVSGLRNAAASAATGEILAMVDADHVITPYWTACAVETLAATGAAATGAYCHRPDDATWVQRAYDRLRARGEAVHEVEWLGSGNLAVRREIFLEIGGFDTTLETCEDVDLCNRMRGAGHRLVSDERLVNVHFGDPRTLKALFFGELWRGKDNLRVTLRGPWTVRALASAVVPVANLALFAAAVLGLGVTRFGRPSISLWALTLFLATVALRARRMARTARSWAPCEVMANLSVAAVYEAARALALVAGVTHRTRQRWARD